MNVIAVMTPLQAGNVYGGSFLDYYVPTALECPKWETDKTITPSPHHPLGAKGVGESATVGAPPAIANAVVDALSHLGVTHVDIPITPEKVLKALRKKQKGEVGRFGAESFPDIPWPEPTRVPTPWEGGDGKAVSLQRV